jgi:hypothetical protein
VPVKPYRHPESVGRAADLDDVAQLLDMLEADLWRIGIALLAQSPSDGVDEVGRMATDSR